MGKSDKYKALSGMLAATMLSSSFSGISALAENTDASDTKPEIDSAIGSEADADAAAVSEDIQADAGINIDEPAEDFWSDTINRFVISAMSEDGDADRDAAQSVIDDITALRESAVDMNSGNYTDYFRQIKTVRIRYDALSYYGKAIVGNANLQMLTSTESKYNTLKRNDINALNDAVDALIELNEDNYLLMSADFVAAREMYEAFNERLNVLRAIADEDASGAEEEIVKAAALAEYDSINIDTEDSCVKLMDIAQNVDIFMNNTMEDFRAAVITSLNFDITALPTGEILPDENPYEMDGYEYITRFVSAGDYAKFGLMEEYINVAIAKYEAISNSPLYSDFLFNDEFKDVVIIYLKNYYKFKTNQLKVVYGAPDALGTNILEDDLWNDATAEILFTYLEKQRANTDNALDAVEVLGGDAAELDAYKNYCAELFAAMNVSIGDEIDKFVEKVLPLTGETNVEPNNNYNEDDIAGKSCIELEFNEDTIDMVAEARNAHRNFNISIQQYLCTYDSVCYNKLFDLSYVEDADYMNSIISDGVNQLKALSESELAKYDALKREIRDYNLTYKSGYEMQFGGRANTNPDEFIAGIEARRAAIKETELEKYYTEFSTQSALNTLNAKAAELDAAIDAFIIKQADIEQLRMSAANALNAYDGFENYFGYDYMMAQAGSYNNFSKHEDVVEFVDDFINIYNNMNPGNSISLDDVMGKFDAMAESKRDYVAKANAYAAKYRSDNFTHLSEVNRLQPYMTQPEFDEVDSLAQIIYKHTDMTGFMSSVSGVYNTAMALPADKETLYLAHDGFTSVYAAKSSYGNLDAQYNGFSLDQKYCVTRETERRLDVMNSEFAAWDKAIDVMNKIYAINGAVEWEDYRERAQVARDAYTAVENHDDVTEKIADAALEDLSFAAEFADLFLDIASVPEITSQYQLDDRYATPNYETVVASLRERFDNLVTDEHESVSALVQRAGDILEQREYEVDCAVRARDVDRSIIALDNYDITDFSEESQTGIYAYMAAYEAVELAVTDLMTEEPGEGTAFTMLLQYSKFTHHREITDGIIANVFISSVEAVGTVDYTSDFDEKQRYITSADSVYENLLNARQRSSSEVQLAMTKLEGLRAELARCRRAWDNSQTAIGMLATLETMLDEQYNEDFKPAREAMYSGVAAAIGEYDEYIDSLKNADDEMRYAYECLDARGYIDQGDMDEAQFMDRFFYYSVQKTIETLWQEAQDAAESGELISSIDVKNAEDEYKALAEHEYAWDTGRSQQELVDNYSKLAWLRQLVNDNESAYISEFEAYMDDSGLMDESITPSTLPITLEFNILHAAELYGAMSDTVKQNVDSSYAARILMLTDALAELKSNIENGKEGDVDRDGRVTIADVVRIVDFAMDNDIDPETTLQFVMADIDGSNEIDVNDVIKAIDLIEF